jgi:glycosyltransferase involved in cell wall biosynthesis
VNHKQKTIAKSILVDAREFVHGRFTGIGRVLEGLTDALATSMVAEKVVLAVYDADLIPSQLKHGDGIKVREIPVSFLKSEKVLSDLSKREFSLFISPYPKLPLFGCLCACIHIIHDVLDLTHPAYKKRLKAFFDGIRLKKALRKADLTWYDSSWSMSETEKLTSYAGSNPKVRYPGIDEKFNPARSPDCVNALRRYALKPGYILILGNGLPHKNLGAILKIANQLDMKIVFGGVPEKNQSFWKTKYPKANATWISHVGDEDLVSVLKCAFCLAQPSTAEGYGYPPLEAMACGVPAVVSNIPVLVETTGGNALTADPHDSMIWLETFKSLESDFLYKEQVEKGLKWVEPLRGRKAWQGYISDIEELLERS